MIWINHDYKTLFSIPVVHPTECAAHGLHKSVGFVRNGRHYYIFVLKFVQLSEN